MIRRWDRWGPISGLLLCVMWSPMAIAIPRLPDLASAERVETFWRANQDLMQAVILSVSGGYFFLLVFLAALAELVRTAPQAGTASWMTFGSAMMFMTALNVALGLDIAGGLLVDFDAAATYVLHTAAFLLAAPAALCGTAFFVAVATLAGKTGIFPRWSAWIAVVGVVANVGAVFGILTLSGPLNSGNGVIGGIAAPLGLFLIWVAAISLWWLRNPRQLVRNSPIATAVRSG